MTLAAPIRPERICANCWAIYRAAKPRPAAAWCWHTGTLAWSTIAGWRLEQPSDAALGRLRAEGAL